MSKNILFYMSIILIFTEYTCYPAPEETSGLGACYGGWECKPIANCHSVAELQDNAIFPCSAHGEPLLICCPPKKLNSTTTSTSKTIVVTTENAIIKSPTTLKTQLNEDIDPKWSKLPKDLHKKIKLLPSNCGNGTLEDRIINGQNSDLGQFPWMALLGYNVDGKIEFWCGGSIISERYILTAAHCEKVGSYQPTIVRLGEWNLNSTIDCVKEDCALPVKDIEVSEIKVHEKYGDKNSPSYQNDIALIRLVKDIEWNDFIYPICLYPEINRNKKIIYTITGWGVSEAGSSITSPILQFAKISLFDFNECNSVAPAELRPLSKSQFCAIGTDANSCKGDSGGPLIFSLNEKYYQKGIVSLGTSAECGTDGKPGIYTEVSHFIRWILKNIN